MASRSTGRTSTARVAASLTACRIRTATTRGHGRCQVRQLFFLPTAILEKDLNLNGTLLSWRSLPATKKLPVQIYVPGLFLHCVKSAPFGVKKTLRSCLPFRF